MTFSPPHPLDAKRWTGQRVGLLGGSFNPPHEGHIGISEIARKTLRLDFIWWLVTPQNPLKTASELMPYETRVEACEAMNPPPDVIISDIEKQLGVNRTYDTVSRLRRLFPATDFILVTGMDNALEFHRWHRWRGILDIVATAHIARPPADSLVESCPLRLLQTQRHSVLRESRRVALLPRRTYWILGNMLFNISSTSIRNSTITTR